MPNTTFTTDYHHADVQVLDKQIAYDGYFQIIKYQLKHRLFNGGWSETIIREVFERGQAAGVLLYDPILNKVVLTEQFRVGTLQDKASPWLLEIVAGILDETDQDFANLARRETREEAGLEPLALMPITEYWASPGACTEKISLFCAKVDASNAGGVHGLAAEHEDIRVVVMDTAEAFAAVSDGRICNALSIIALQWLQLNQVKVNAEWLKK